MKIAVVCDAHIFRTKNNEYWCTTVYSYSFFQRFTQVFDKVKVVARVKDLEFPSEGKFLRVDGPNVEIHPVCFFRGPKEFFQQFCNVLNSLKKFESGCDVILYRMPSTTAQIAYLITRKINKPKGIEMVYNLHDELVDNTVPFFRKIISYINHKMVQKACRDRQINGVSYVTKEMLQKLYPSFSRLHGKDTNHFENYYSTIQYKPDCLSSVKKFANKTHWLITHVVIHIQSKARGHETLIKALKCVRDQGYDMEIEFIGDGPMVLDFKKLAASLGVADYVHFVGLLPSSQDVYEHLRKSDIFVYPTHFGGLPRALIEAMGAGLPCISTPIAGIPELLSEDEIVPVDDVVSLTNRLILFFKNPSLLDSLSKKNIGVAQEYTNEKLQKRRNSFYTQLAEVARNK